MLEDFNLQEEPIFYVDSKQILAFISILQTEHSNLRGGAGKWASLPKLCYLSKHIDLVIEEEKMVQERDLT